MIRDAGALPLAFGARLTIVLAPVLAAATAVERTLESVFNMIEGSWHTMVVYPGCRMRWLKGEYPIGMLILKAESRVQ